MRTSVTLPSLLMITVGLPGLVHASTYTVTDLGTLGGSTSSGYGVNNAGAAVGQSDTATGTTTQGFVYAPGTKTITAIGTFQADGGGMSFANGINSSGVAVGYATTDKTITETDGEILTGVTDAFAYSNGKLTDLGSLGGLSTQATAINDSGLVVGYGNPTTAGQHSFTYNLTTKVLTDIGTATNAAGSSSTATAVNASGVIAGSSTFNTPSGTQNHAATYSNGQWTDLGGLPNALATYAAGINASGEVVGRSFVGGQNHAFAYTAATGMVDLGDLGGGDTKAEAINASGMIVGSSDTGQTDADGDDIYHAFITTIGGTMVDLNTLLPAGVEMDDATGITDNGTIIGSGTINGNFHAIELTLTPEPASLTMLALGGLLVGRRRRRV